MAFKAKLKVLDSEEIGNLFVKKTAVKIADSKKGWQYAEVTIGDYTIIIAAKFVHELKNGAYSIGIKDNFKYPIKNVKSTVRGIDLMEYAKTVNKEIKESKETAEKPKETKSKTKTKTTTK